MGSSFLHGWICSIKDDVFDTGVSTFLDLGSTVHTVMLSMVIDNNNYYCCCCYCCYWYNSI